MATTILLAILCVGVTEVLSEERETPDFRGEDTSRLLRGSKLHGIMGRLPPGTTPEKAKEIFDNLPDEGKKEVIEHIQQMAQRHISDNQHQGHHHDAEEGDVHDGMNRKPGMTHRLPHHDRTGETDRREMIGGPNNVDDLDEFRGKGRDDTKDNDEQEKPAIRDDNEEAPTEEESKKRRIFQGRRPRLGRKHTENTEEEVTSEVNEDEDGEETPNGGLHQRIRQRFGGNRRQEANEDQDGEETPNGGLRQRIRQQFGGKGRHGGKRKQGGRNQQDDVQKEEEEEGQETSDREVSEQERKRFQRPRPGMREKGSLRRKQNQRD